MHFFEVVFDILACADVEKKIQLLNDHYLDLMSQVQNGYLKPSRNIQPISAIGLPQKPELVPPRQLKNRKLTSVAGKAAMAHAIAHIEFNAINLALDACYRFQSMPPNYYSDWLRVAHEEAKHFSLLNEYLHELNYNYGDLPAHDGLWLLAQETDYDVLARMALVPRLMEARGLDVTPAIMNKFQQVGDDKMVAILKIIYQEEIGHVMIGNQWFHFLCQQKQMEPLEQFEALLLAHFGASRVKLPLNEVARLKAGFQQAELDLLNQIGAGTYLLPSVELNKV